MHMSVLRVYSRYSVPQSHMSRIPHLYSEISTFEADLVSIADQMSVTVSWFLCASLYILATIIIFSSLFAALLPVIFPALGVSAPWLDWNAPGENGDAVRFLLSMSSLNLSIDVRHMLDRRVSQIVKDTFNCEHVFFAHVSFFSTSFHF